MWSATSASAARQSAHVTASPAASVTHASTAGNEARGVAERFTAGSRVHEALAHPRQATVGVRTQLTGEQAIRPCHRHGWHRTRRARMRTLAIGERGRRIARWLGSLGVLAGCALVLARKIDLEVVGRILAATDARLVLLM